MALIDERGVKIDDAWHYAKDPADVGDPAATVTPYEHWIDWRGCEAQRPAGVWLQGHYDLSQIEAVLPHVRLLVIEFAHARDGRGLTLARMLRERYQFTGDLRAAGPLLPDQFGFLLACGFSTVLASPTIPLDRWREAVVSRGAVAAKPRTLLERLGRFGSGAPAAVDEMLSVQGDGVKEIGVVPR